MPKITFLNLGEVLEIHRDQIARYGGLPGLRDLDLLKSAVAMPQATFDGEFLHTDIFEMAAAYLFHIVGCDEIATANGRKRLGTEKQGYGCARACAPRDIYGFASGANY